MAATRQMSFRHNGKLYSYTKNMSSGKCSFMCNYKPIDEKQFKSVYTERNKALKETVN